MLITTQKCCFFCRNSRTFEQVKTAHVGIGAIQCTSCKRLVAFTIQSLSRQYTVISTAINSKEEKEDIPRATPPIRIKEDNFNPNFDETII